MKGTGPSGLIVHVYAPAVTFGRWSCDADQQGGTLTAEIVSVDNYRIKQRPLYTSIAMGRATWRRPVMDVQISGKTLTATLGAVERPANATGRTDASA